MGENFADGLFVGDRPSQAQTGVTPS
jgi:hypothetical protein